MAEKDIGCYAIRCKECELRYAEPNTEERDECTRRAKIALAMMHADRWHGRWHGEDR